MSDNDYAVKEIDAMEAVYGGAFKRARAELGVEAFGMAVIDLPPNFEHYPEHRPGRVGQPAQDLAGAGGNAVARARRPRRPALPGARAQQAGRAGPDREYLSAVTWMI